MNEEEKEAVEYLKVRLYGNAGCKFIDVAQKDLRVLLKLIEKQQKEIKKLKKKCNSKYYYTIKCRELEKEINNNWKDKINKLKEEIETELISNPYDFSYLLNELLEE